ncbi:hypothetical protein ZIOFF_054542 [Zingiber officinale]|uniref:Inhibitor I9 domain-containing protein n=1 Tax=Zingiber officinale TaxID=94328 RepID=A0A8J5KR83_ZINOF|nr:hypothetical protein ZIOFF_054542 [Zingiber officinale]
MLFTSASCLLQTKAPTSSSSLLTLNLFLQLAQAREEKRVAMAPLRLSFFLYLLLLCCCSSLSIPELEKKTYIVHVAKSHMPDDFPEHRLWYEASLRSVSDTAEMLYAYDTVAHGFSARLSAAEARALQGRPGVVGVQPEVRYELHTTRTPEFLGIDREGLVPQSNAEGDVVVGVLDTGVWPERASYGDAGLGPVPASWKGACEEGKDFEPAAVCNRKLVGARFFSKGYEANPDHLPAAQRHLRRQGDLHGVGPQLPLILGGIQDCERLGRRQPIDDDDDAAHAHTDQRAKLRERGGEEELYGELLRGVAAVWLRRVRPPPVVRPEARGGEPSGLHVDVNFRDKCDP